MTTLYPLLLDLTGERVVVVGGGPVAARRAAGCVQAGADVVVVAPAVCEDIADLARAGPVRVVAREYLSGDLDGARLVHATTGDRAVDEAVATDAAAQGAWCVRADDAAASRARVPAVARSSGIVVAVGSEEAADPRRAMAVRDAVALALDTGMLPVRRRRQSAGDRAGRVSLVGGGPGDPGLLTVRGRQRMAEADVVVVDRLAPREVLDQLEPDVLVVDVGKSPDHHPVPQDEINRLLVEHARAGRRVVRLKGGDPHVLGRGGEELAFCRAEGVAVEVVPGVTSAVAVPAAAGIPVTHRGLSRQVTVVSGHDGADWGTLARLDGTLVILMGVAGLPHISASLLRHGMEPTTPVAVVEQGFHPDQRTTRGTLADIAAVAHRRGVRAPAVVVVGAVAALGDGESDREHGRVAEPPTS